MAHVASLQPPRQRGATRTSLPSVIDAVKALAHPGRLRLLAMLRGGDLCVCQMTAVLELAASTVSSHLSDLRRAGLVTERKNGKWVHYHLADAGPLAGLVRQALQLLDDDDRLRQDARIVEGLRLTPLETLCRSGYNRATVGVVPRRSSPVRPRGRRSRPVGVADERRAR